MTAEQDRHDTMAKKTTCHKITIGATAIMEITMVIDEESRRRNVKQDIYTLEHAGTSGATRWRFACGNFHFIISGPLPPINSSPVCPSRLVMHHFENNVRGFLTATLYTRVERLLLPLSLQTLSRCYDTRYFFPGLRNTVHKFAPFIRSSSKTSLI